MAPLDEQLQGGQALDRQQRSIQDNMVHQQQGVPQQQQLNNQQNLQQQLNKGVAQQSLVNLQQQPITDVQQQTVDLQPAKAGNWGFKNVSEWYIMN